LSPRLPDDCVFSFQGTLRKPVRLLSQELGKSPSQGVGIGKA